MAPDETDTNRRRRGRPPTVCPGCGHAFTVRYLHPVLTAVRYCPRCGARVR